MSTADERLLRALNAIQCQCTPVEQARGHKAGCWMPGLSAVHATFDDGDIGPWIPIADPAQPPPRDRELIVACTDWPHATELGRPVPVRVGLLGATGRWTIWGAEWIPTHYKVAPTGPRQSRGIAR